MSTREDQHGHPPGGDQQPGAFSSWIAAATAYANDGTATTRSTFLLDVGFEWVGDLAWAAGDSGAGGFLIGGTVGRTTLNGEGLHTRMGTRTCLRR